MIRTAVFARALHAMIEGDALRGALAIRARLYPHQVANVRALLSAPELRHLLVDPPGSGKTIQALMVLNALRRAHPDLKTLIIVPDNVIAIQWSDELSWALRAPLDPKGGVEIYSHDETYNSPIARARQLLNPLNHDIATIKAYNDIQNVDYINDFDFVIIDEVHRVNNQTLERVYRAHPRHLLMLTATPPRFAQYDQQNPNADELSRLKHLMCLLEPEEWRARELAPNAMETWLNELFNPLEPITLRRVLCSSPASALRDIRVLEYEPSQWERRAEELSIQADHLAQTQAPNKRSTIFENTLKGPWALQDYLITSLNDLIGAQGLINQARAELPSRFVNINPDHLGRARALCDLLASIGVIGDNPTSVLISSSDAATTKHIQSWLSSELEVPPSKIRVIRDRESQQRINQGAQAATARHFERRAPVTILEGRGEGFNLQQSRHLVFFSPPNSQRQYEQFIGRLDRPGNIELEDGSPLMVYMFAERGARSADFVRALTPPHGDLDPFIELLSITEKERELVSLASRPTLGHQDLQLQQDIPWWRLSAQPQVPSTLQSISGRCSEELFKHLARSSPNIRYSSSGIRHQGCFLNHDSPQERFRCHFNFHDAQGHVNQNCEFWKATSLDTPPLSLFNVRQQRSGVLEWIYGARASAGIPIFERALQLARQLPMDSGSYLWRVPQNLYDQYAVKGQAQLFALIERYDPLQDLRESGDLPIALSIAFPPRVIFKANITNHFQPPPAKELLLTALADNRPNNLTLMNNDVHQQPLINLYSRIQEEVRDNLSAGLVLAQAGFEVVNSLINSANNAQYALQAHHLHGKVLAHHQTIKAHYITVIDRVKALLAEEQIPSNESTQLMLSFELLD